jgi:CRP-like cAMP-binding protein
MDPSGTPDVLPDCALLAGFDDADRHALSECGEFLEFKAGRTVIGEGQPQESLYLLLHGRLNAVHKVEGGEAPLGTIRDGEWFGEVNIFDPQQASAMVVAHGDARMWRISRANLEEFLNTHPLLGCQLLLGVGEVLARRTRELTTKLNATWEISW